MIQRVQSIWLFLAALFTAATFKFSFFSGNNINATTNIKEWIEFIASQNTIVMILAVAIVVSSLIAIFMYKDRKRQMLISLITAFIAVIQIALYFNYKSAFTEASLNLGSLFSFVTPVLLFLAAKAIYADEKLVKNADRLR